jgi:hypothetical protein
VVQVRGKADLVVKLSVVGVQQTERPSATKRNFLILSLATLAAGCAQPLVPEVQLPDWDMIKRNYEASFSGPDFDRVRRVAQKVLPAPVSGGPWQFGIVNDANGPILAFRGNGLVVATSELKLCENDGQLGALLVWVVHFPLPSLRTTDERKLRLDIGPIIEADISSIRALTKAGYDPRDALVIAKRVPVTFESEPQLNMPRWVAMEQELRALGYQV